MQELTDVLKFAGPIWVVNMALNGLYVMKLVFPRTVNYDKPLDMQRSLSDGRRILGNSTTWPGILVALTAGLAIAIILSLPMWHGFLFGLTVYAGHALGSFIKRRLGQPDGHFTPFVDHGDYIIVSGIIFGAIGLYSWTIIAAAILVTFIVHPAVTMLAYSMGLKKHPL